MSDADRATIKGVAATLRTEADKLDAVAAPPTWWTVKAPPYKLAATGKTVPLFNENGTRRTAAPVERMLPQPGAPADKLWDVFARSGDLLKVYDPAGTANDWWVKAADVAPA